MRASLPMYDRVEAQAANDRLWAGIRDRLRDAGIAAPESLDRGAAPLWDHWTDPGLVLSQTCGLPFRARLHGQVTLVASPDYGLEGCPPGFYRSVLVARADDTRKAPQDFAGAALAFNDPLSQSGWGAVWEFARDRGIILRPTLETGSHRASALAVAEGRADWASLDAQTWAMIRRWDGWAEGLQVVGHTRPTPALPFITALGRDPVPLRDALGAAVAAMSAADRAVLALKGIAVIPASAYLAVPVPPAPTLAAA
jgi:ABC-type phosphate/phosphonate transport system substrate-binding protein